MMYPVAMSAHRLTPEERQESIEARIIKGDGCWTWSGTHTYNGYAFASHTRFEQRVHRAMYEWHVGPIPEGFVVDHLCRNRGCVRPAHLEAVTVSENARRGVVARFGTTCRAGKHDVTLPNAYYNYGRRRKSCRLCLLEWQKDNYRSRQEMT
jgi:hypothetical protein